MSENRAESEISYHIILTSVIVVCSLLDIFTAVVCKSHARIGLLRESIQVVS